LNDSLAGVAQRAAADPRLAQLCHWLEHALGFTAFDIAPASADASFRRYFRVTRAGHEPLIVMDAPPAKEDVGPFLRVAAMLEQIGVNAPRVLARSLGEGFLLLTDLGTRMYLPELATHGRADALYGDALDALVRIQARGRDAATQLPPYSEKLLQFEMSLLPDWLLQRHLALDVTPAETAMLQASMDALVANALEQPQVFVHRDYHSRNLMVAAPNPGVLDFQDAVLGPITYDLVSLLRDAYVEWDEEIQLDFAIRYWERARAAGLPVAADFAAFWSDFEWMGVQRQLKVLGIFARLCIRDGKSGYVKDMPRVRGYLRRAVARYRELDPLAALLDALEDAAPAAQPA